MICVEKYLYQYGILLNAVYIAKYKIFEKNFRCKSGPYFYKNAHVHIMLLCRITLKYSYLEKEYVKLTNSEKVSFLCFWHREEKRLEYYSDTKIYEKTYLRYWRSSIKKQKESKLNTISLMLEFYVIHC